MTSIVKHYNNCSESEEDSSINPSRNLCISGGGSRTSTPDFEDYEPVKPEGLLLYQYYHDNKGSEEFRKYISKRNIRYDILGGIYNYLFNVKLINEINDIINMSSSVSVDDYAIMSHAVRYKDKDIINKLLQKGYDINNKHSLIREDVLRVTIYSSDLDMCKFLIDKGYNIEKNISSYLNESVYNSCDDFFDYFFNLGIKIDKYENLIHLLCCYRPANMYIKYIIKFLELGYDINIVSKENLSTIMVNCNIEQLSLLMNNGIKLSEQVLSKAILYKKYELISFLLDNGLEFNKNVTKNIMDNGKIDHMSKLLEYNCDFSFLDEPYDIDIATILSEHNVDKDKIINYYFNNTSSSIKSFHCEVYS